MAGKITVTNFSENELWVNIMPNNQPNVVPVASGTLGISQTSGFPVSGYNSYQVNFFAPPQSLISARNIVPDALVAISITDTTTEDESNK